MKIAVPVVEKSMDAHVAHSFGRSPYFFIYEENSKEHVVLENSAITSQGGAGIKAAQLIVDNKVDVLITPPCGMNAAKILQAANIKVYKSINDTAMDNIGAFLNGKLSLLKEFHPGFHNHGGK